MINPYRAAQEFVADFSRMEHDLKRSGYLQRRKHATADWGRFAQSLGSDFFKRINESGIARTLINAPPRVLLENLTWAPENPPPLTNVAELIIEEVCRVRNNYIHGEKFSGGPDPNEWQRGAVLIEEAHAVLKEAGRCLNGKPDS